MTRLWLAGGAVRIWGGEGAPSGFVWQGVSHRVLMVCNDWRVHTRWWEPDQAIWREYVKVATDTGLLCLLYQDLLKGGWFLSRIYD